MVSKCYIGSFIASDFIANFLRYNITPLTTLSSFPITTVGQITAYFPRQGQNPVPVLVSLYSNAKSTIDVAIYSLTKSDIVQALLDANKRGIIVRVVSDATQSGGASQKVAIYSLLSAGIPVKIDKHSGLMHLKMSIIDNAIVTTGSYNYSEAATTENDEMFVVINDVIVAADCQTEFDRMWDDAEHYVLATVN